jgi:hypothetical protein
MPFAHFIDGLNCDKFGKLTVEAVLTTCLWFKQKVRNRSEAWWHHGFTTNGLKCQCFTVLYLGIWNEGIQSNF